jgi:hypothetical protein
MDRIKPQVVRDEEGNETSFMNKGKKLDLYLVLNPAVLKGDRGFKSLVSHRFIG